MIKTKNVIICAFFAAILCITAPFAVVIGPVPVTFVLFSLALTAFVAGSKRGAQATLIYILIGLAGLPVFSGFKGGLGAIMSPTGGFVFSYIFVVLILGCCKKTKKTAVNILLCMSALLVCYFFGTIWYMLCTDSGLITALVLCVLPFIPFDIIKLVIAGIIASAVHKTKIDL